MVRAAALALLLPACAALPARAFDLEQDAQLWTPVLLDFPDAGRVVSTLEVNPRARGDLGRMSQLLVRPWLGWRVSKTDLAHVGYAWVRNDAASVVHVHLAWEQYQKAFALAGGRRLAVRGRMEQRFFPGAEGASWRARAMLRLEQELGASGRYAALSSETFVNLNAAPGAPPSGFDHHRAYLGLGRRLRGATVEGGYQHLLFRRPGLSDRHLHTLLLTVRFSPWAS